VFCHLKKHWPPRRLLLAEILYKEEKYELELVVDMLIMLKLKWTTLHLGPKCSF
jgi:hypothetical protein